MYRVSSPQELLAQLVFLQNRSRFSEDREEGEEEEEASSSSTGRELLDLILTFNDADDADDEEHVSDEDGVSRDDFFS